MNWYNYKINKLFIIYNYFYNIFTLMQIWHKKDTNMICQHKLSCIIAILILEVDDSGARWKNLCRVMDFGPCGATWPNKPMDFCGFVLF